MHMSDVILDEAFITLPEDADKQTVITELAQVMHTVGAISEAQVETVIEGAMARETIGSTGIGHGIAIPHCRTAIVDRIVCVFGSSPSGIDFDSLDGEPVHAVFLLLTPPDHKDDHLQLMKNFASQIRKEHFCEFLRQCTTAKAVKDLLAEFESR